MEGIVGEMEGEMEGNEGGNEEDEKEGEDEQYQGDADDIEGPDEES